MTALTPASAQTVVAASLAALRHHSAFAASILRAAPLAFDPNIRPVAYEPGNAKHVAEALALDKRLPSEKELDALRLGIDDALAGPQVEPDALGRMLPMLFAGRSAGRPETIPARLAALMEVISFERRLTHITGDMVALAVLADLRTNRFPPEPSEFVAAIAKARQQIASVSDALAELDAVRSSVDDLLVASGIRLPEPDDDGDGIPWEGPKLRMAGR